MKRIVLVVLLVTATSAAWAEWVQIGSNTSVVAYSDAATIRRSGDRAKMWEMYDFKKKQEIVGKSYLSQKTRNEYDCEYPRSRLLDFAWHSGQMGAGEVVFAYDGKPTNWELVGPDSAEAAFWKTACGKN